MVGPELPASQHAAKLRRLVVELAPPQFAAPDPTQPDPTPPGMNSEQHVAVQWVLAAQDYALVLGMPGAGKTTTIVAMVQALVAAGKSVLLTSYTNRWGGGGVLDGWVQLLRDAGAVTDLQSLGFRQDACLLLLTLFSLCCPTSRRCPPSPPPLSPTYPAARWTTSS